MVDNQDVQEIVQQELDLTGAFKRVLKAASYTEDLAKGLHEVCKAIDNTKVPIFCVLSNSCDEDQYKKLVEALCKENGVPLVRIADGKTLGEWIGLCKYDNLMNPRNPRRCSSCVLKQFAIEDEASKMVQEALKDNKEITLE